MKKIISILLAMIMLLSFVSVTAFAKTTVNSELQSNTDPIETEFVNLYVDNAYIPYSYERIYDKVNENGDIEWSLISASSSGPLPAMYYAVFDDMVSLRGRCVPFKNRYAIFDWPKWEFIDICDLYSFDVYEGLREQLYKQDFLYPIGDADLDRKLTVLDATMIQKVVAKLCSFGSGDDLTSRLVIKGELSYISDINRDGSRNILDATAIQKKLAGLDEEPKINEELVLVTYEEPLYGAPYPEKPDGCVELDYEMKRNAQSYGYSASHLGIYEERFFAVIKSKEQYKYVFDRFTDYGFDDKFYEKYWVVASVVRANNELESYIIDDISILDDTLYVQVSLYKSISDRPVNPAMPPFISLVAVEKEKLANVTNIVRVER